MFPSKRELSTIKCPKGTDCTLGVSACPFGHAAAKDIIPSMSYFAAHRGKAGRTAGDARPRRAKGEQHEDPVSKLPRLGQVCPQLPLEQHSRVPWRVRQASLEKIFTELKSASEALSTERELYERSQTKQAYSNNYASLILRLRRREAGMSGGPQGVEATPVDRLREAIHGRQVLSENGYLFASEDIQGAVEKRETQGNSHLCDRCKARFVPSEHYGQSLEERQPCRFHFGPKIKSADLRLHSCCHRPVGEAGCTTAPSHVFSVIPPLEHFEALAHWPRSVHQKPVVALDVEMIYTVEGQFPARVSMVDWHGHTVLDVLVRPPVPVVDFNTRYSGIDAEDLQADHGGIIDHSDLNKKLAELVGPDTIFIGHSLENDMLALRLISDQIIDTAILFPHPQRQEAKQSLKALSKEYLKEFIQEGSDGHCSVQDALACLKLVKAKLNIV